MRSASMMGSHYRGGIEQGGYTPLYIPHIGESPECTGSALRAFLHTRYFRRVEGKLSSILSSKKLVGEGAAMNWRCTSGDTPRYWMTLPSLNSTSSSCDFGS